MKSIASASCCQEFGCVRVFARAEICLSLEVAAERLRECSHYKRGNLGKTEGPGSTSPHQPVLLRNANPYWRLALPVKSLHAFDIQQPRSYERDSEILIVADV